MNKRGINFWDILAWIALGIIVIWLILKLFGVINTPLWLEYVPVYSAVYISGWAMSTLVRAVQDIGRINRNLSFLNGKFNEIDKSIEIIKSNCKKCK